jgi:hypothetical protein
MLTTEEIGERFKAGETTLFQESKFLYQTQGIQAVYDFARDFGEKIGAEGEDLIMKYAAQFVADENEVKLNQKAAQEIAMAKAAKTQEKAAKQAENARMASVLTESKNAPLKEIVEINKAELFPVMGIRPANEVGVKIKPDAPVEAIIIQKATPKNVLFIALGLLIIAYFYYNKK